MEIFMRNFILVLAFFGLFFSTPVLGQNFDEIAPTEKQSKLAADTPAPVKSKASGDCQDDPRLETDIIEIMETSEPVKPLLTVTPETFLNMDDEVVTALGGKMLVCPNNPVLKSGKTMKKIQMDFAPLWANIRKAAADENVAQLKKLLDNFRALPMSSAEIVNLAVPLNMDEGVAKKLFSAAGMEMSENSDYPNCVIEFYTLLGGKATDNPLVYVDAYLDPKTMDKIKEENKDEVIFMIGQIAGSNTGGQEKRVLGMLKAAGVNARKY